MPVNNKYVILERRAQVAELHAKGYRQHEIAQIVGVTQQQVSNDLLRIREAWKEQAVENIAEAQAVELAKIALVENEAWKAWEKSKEDYIKKQVKRVAYKDGKAKGKRERPDIERTDTDVVTFGNPSYLKVVMDCIQKRMDMLGLKAPEKVATYNEHYIGGKAPSDNPFEALTDEQLESLAEIAEIIDGEEERNSD